MHSTDKRRMHAGVALRVLAFAALIGAVPTGELLRQRGCHQLRRSDIHRYSVHSYHQWRLGNGASLYDGSRDY